MRHDQIMKEWAEAMLFILKSRRPKEDQNTETKATTVKRLNFNITKDRYSENFKQALREHRVVQFDDIIYKAFQSPGEASVAALDARRQGFESAHVIMDFEG